jgi:hypothetical protein
MFAPPVARAQAKAASSSTDTIQQQRKISLPRRWPGFGERQERETHPALDQAPMPNRGSTPAISWDFGKIPLFPPERSTPPLMAAPPRHTIQPKLSVGPADDPLEHEADRIADQTMQKSATELSIGASQVQVSRKCAACEEDERAQALQTKRAGPPVAADEGLDSVSDVLRSPGRPLDPASRAYFAPRFGRDFSRVRVYDGAEAAASARAIGALAYTVGGNIVFGNGQYAPETAEGAKLIAHELAHVVQQCGLQPLEGKFAGQPEPSRAPPGLVSRKPSPKDEEAKKNAVAQHQEQQRHIADFITNGRKISPDPTKGLLDGDNLFHNTIELLDDGKLTLTILSPTHYSSNRHFDTRVKYSAVGGDYAADPSAVSPGTMFDDTDAAGKVQPAPAPLTITTLPPKVEHLPGETDTKPGEPIPGKTSSPPPPTFSPGDMLIFTHGDKITEAGFKNTFVHEGQHVADLSPKPPVATNWQDLLDAYKSEFRAFWIQPPPPRTGGPAPATIDSLPDAKGKSDNSTKVTTPHNCTICPAPDPSTKTAKGAYEKHETAMKNPRQEQIFWHIISHYQAMQYDCCYVFNEAFHKAVDDFAYPASVNLINSDRLLRLNLELQTLNSSMTAAQIGGSQLAPLLAALEPLDWAFLADPKLSAPLWEAIQKNTPKFVYNAVKALGKSAGRKPVTADDVNAALAGKLKP